MGSPIAMSRDQHVSPNDSSDSSFADSIAPPYGKAPSTHTPPSEHEDGVTMGSVTANQDVRPKVLLLGEIES